MDKHYFLRFHVFMVLVIIAIAILFSGCASEEDVWVKSASENTIASYENYLEKYPDGENAKEAFWQIAKKTNSIKLYKEYQSKYPAGDYVQLAKLAEEQIAWGSTQKTIVSLEYFLKEYPDGKYCEEALETLEELQWQKSATKEPFIIDIKVFPLDYRGYCTTSVEIYSVSGNIFEFGGENSQIAIRDGNWALWCYGALHTWIGENSYKGYTFKSDEKNPLQFTVKEEGYVFVKGRGQVTKPDGTIVILYK